MTGRPHPSTGVSPVRPADHFGRIRPALERLAQVPVLLVALDFDGTLAPEVDHPGQARALPEAKAAVIRLLALPKTSVALVSGRTLDSLEAVAELPDDVLLAGSHGVEIRLDDTQSKVALDDDDRARIAMLGTVLGSIEHSFEGVWLESKPTGFALHTRLATAQTARAAQDRALSELAAHEKELTVRQGKNVLEFSVRSATKAHAIERLRSHIGASAVFFAGDDVTDEDAFAGLGPADVGVKIGDGVTAAGYRLARPADLALLLADLATQRERFALKAGSAKS